MSSGRKGQKHQKEKGFMEAVSEYLEARKEKLREAFSSDDHQDKHHHGSHDKSPRQLSNPQDTVDDRTAGHHHLHPGHGSPHHGASPERHHAAEHEHGHEHDRKGHSEHHPHHDTEGRPTGVTDQVHRTYNPADSDCLDYILDDSDSSSDEDKTTDIPLLKCTHVTSDAGRREDTKSTNGFKETVQKVINVQKAIEFMSRGNSGAEGTQHHNHHHQEQQEAASGITTGREGADVKSHTGSGQQQQKTNDTGRH